jgi:hypothetical protein
MPAKKKELIRRSVSLEMDRFISDLAIAREVWRRFQISYRPKSFPRRLNRSPRRTESIFIANMTQSPISPNLTLKGSFGGIVAMN